MNPDTRPAGHAPVAGAIAYMYGWNYPECKEWGRDQLAALNHLGQEWFDYHATAGAMDRRRAQQENGR